MMIPTMSDYASYLGTNLASLQTMQTKTKSFRIEDILDIRDQQDQIYTGVRAECEVNCYDKMRLDGKRIRGPRKDRTIFSKIQLFRLERRFHDQKYLSSYEKALIAHSLQLTQQQVQTWFQNRRAKAKREEREKKKQVGKSMGSSPPPSSSPGGSFEVDADTPSSSGYGMLSENTLTSSGNSPLSPSRLQSPRGEESPSSSTAGTRLSPVGTSLVSSPPPTSLISTTSPLISRSPLISSSPFVSTSPLISTSLISPTSLISSAPLISPVMRLVSMCSSVGTDITSSLASRVLTSPVSSIASRVLTSPVATKPLSADNQTDKLTNSALHRFSIDHLTSRR